MSASKVNSTFLALLLVLNTSCGCLSVTDEADSGPHAHHQQSGQSVPGGDCRHLDCSGHCERAVGALPVPGKDATQPAPCNGLDDIVWSAVDGVPSGPSAAMGTTGPPPDPIARTLATPVRRFDLQLE